MIKRLILFFTIVSGFTSVYAQSSSSYTRYGLGDPVYSYSGRRLGMGELGTSIADADFVSPLNPASWYALTRTRIETGISYNGMFLSNANSSYYTAETDFTGFTIGFPASTTYGIGVVLGIVPYSNVSYKVNERLAPFSSIAVNDYNIEYEGRGGLSKVFIGSSYKLPFDLAVGASLDYYFGNLNYYSRADFPGENDYDSEYRRTYSPYSIGSTFGLISPDLSGIFNIESIKNLRLGFAANWISKMNADTTLESSSSLFSDSLGHGIVDIEIPLRLSAGLSFLLSENYLIAIDYMHQGMEDYRFNGIKSPNLRNATKVSLGFEYRPGRRPGDTFWEQIIFRGGLSYEELPYTFNGTDINEYSIAGGLSLPLSLENTIDIGIQYSSRGESDGTLHKEDRIKINLGISLGDIWFIRQDK